MAFAVVALAIAIFVPSERDVNVLVIVGLVVGYVAVSTVRFEFGIGYVVPEQLVLIPMLALAPLPLVPALVALASLLSVIPDLVKRQWHWDRTITSIGDCWFVVPPVLVLALLAPGTPTLDDAPVYALALVAQLGTRPQLGDPS